MLEHNTDKAFEYYQKAIKKIMKNEDVLTPMFPRRPPGTPADMPIETLAMTFRNFCGFFRDPALNYTEGMFHVCVSSSYVKCIDDIWPMQQHNQRRTSSSRVSAPVVIKNTRASLLLARSSC